jgi:DNA-binding NarL/FixJ family response regulator
VDVAESSSRSGAFVGRARELAALGQAFDAARDGRPGAAVVVGEAGIGKTRLAEAFAASVAGSGARVMTGACLELGAAIPYLPFAEMLRELLRDLPEAERARLLGPARTVIDPMLPPALRSTPGRATSPAGEARSAAGRLAVFEGLLGLTGRLADAAPLLVVLEDIQWADSASLDLVTYLSRNVRDARVLLLMTARSGGIEDGRHARPVGAFVSGLARQIRLVRIELPAFGRDEIEDQARAVLGRPPDPALVDRVLTQSGGNPLYAAEIIAWSQGRAGAISGPPGPLRDLVLARMAELSPDARDVLRSASAAGRIVDDGLLEAASGQPTAVVVEGLRAAIAEGILVPVAAGDRGRPPIGYRFRHQLVRDAIAAELLPGEASRLHAAFAEALTQRAPEGVDPGELAVHWDAAGQHDRALVAHVDAGIAARELFAFDLAHAHFERALELWSRTRYADDLTGLDHVDLLAEAASAATLSGDFRRAIELDRRVLGALADMPHDPRLARARNELRRCLWASGDLPGALAEAETAVAVAERVGADDLASALGHLAALFLFTGRVRQARTVGDRALRLARERGSRNEAAVAAGVIGWSVMYSGRVADAIERIRGAWREAEDLGDPYGRALAHDHLARALEFGGRWQEAVDVALAGVELARAHGLERTFGAQLAADAARCLYRLGRLRDAQTVLTAARRSGPVAGGEAAVRAVGAVLAIRAGELATAEAELHDGRSQAVGAAGDADAAGWLLAALAELALVQGDLDRALDAVRSAIRPPGARPDAPPLVTLGTALGSLLVLAARAHAEQVAVGRARGEREVPAALREDARRIAALIAWLERRSELRAAWSVDLATARAELLRADDAASPAATAAWRSVVDVARRVSSSSPPAEAYAQLRLAESLALAHGARSELAAALGRGVRLAVDAGCTPLERELRLLARRTGVAIEDDARVVTAGGSPQGEGRPGPDRPAADDVPLGLTDREREVLSLVATGRSNREVAERLFISPKTASVHVSNILGKLGVSSRLEAALVAQRVGLVADDEPDATPRGPEPRPT